MNDLAYTLHFAQECKVENKEIKGRWKKGNVPWTKGKKWEEIYGEDRVEEMKRKASQRLAYLRAHGIKGGSGMTARPVIQMDKYGDRLHWYPSAVAAAKKLGLHSTNISAVCRGLKKTCGGFRWKFDEKYE